MSYEAGSGMKLRDLARSSGDPKSLMSAFHIFRSRFGNRETARRSRKSYEYAPHRLLLCLFSCCSSKQPWSLYLGFFTLLAILGPMLSFLFGRIMVIKTVVRVRATNLLLVLPNP